MKIHTYFIPASHGEDMFLKDCHAGLPEAGFIHALVPASSAWHFSYLNIHIATLRLLTTLGMLLVLYIVLTCFRIKYTIMKLLSIIGMLCCSIATYSQTTPAPPYYPAPSPAYNYPPANNGTPMVRNPVENNNPSVQASIPILNKPSSLETDMGGYVAQGTRIIYNNAQQNTPAKNMATEGTSNIPTAVASTSISSDTVMRTPVAASTPNTVVKTTVIYNNTTGTDVSKTTDKTTLISNKRGNSAPVTQMYISENVVNRFKTLYGENLYDIRQVRYGNSNTMYIIRVMKEGMFNTMYLDENGDVVVQ